MQSGMSIDQFWHFVGAVHSMSPNDMEAKCNNLDAALRKLPLHDVQNFERHFNRLLHTAYTWDLWAAACVIGHGCSDDGFMDFRSGLISLGEAPFTNALSNPESLADLNLDPAWAEFEGYQYVAHRVWNESFGKEFPGHIYEPHPNEPAGQRFVEWELSTKYPRLAAKFGHKDSDWYFLRDQAHQQAQKQFSIESLADLMLRAGLISPAGFIPSYKLLRAALNTGSAAPANGNPVTWPPFDLEEGVYWGAVIFLENLPPETLSAYPHIKAGQLKQDLISTAPDMATWLRSQRLA